jgi:hypothetical protein
MQGCRHALDTRPTKQRGTSSWWVTTDEGCPHVDTAPHFLYACELRMAGRLLCSQLSPCLITSFVAEQESCMSSQRWEVMTVQRAAVFVARSPARSE